MSKQKIPDLNGMGKRKVADASPTAAVPAPAVPAIQMVAKTPEAKPKGDASRAPVRQTLRKALMARNAELRQLPHICDALKTRNAFLDVQPALEVGK